MSASSPDGLTGRTLSADWMRRPSLQQVMAALTAEDVDARYVGGCVRDTILEKDVSDIDIGIPLPPTEVERRLTDAGLRAIPTGIDFGTITAVADGEAFEVTSLRLDVETDGRRAVVSYTDNWRNDALRRDFTINALSLRPEGTVFDYYDGLTDLEARCIRFVGESRERIREDALRILRFYRFAGHFGVAQADPAARTACRELADLIPNLSKERISQELLKTLIAPLAVEAMRAMKDDGILKQIHGGPWTIEHLDSLVDLEKITDLRADPARRLAAAFGDPARVETLARSLKMSSAQIDAIGLATQQRPDAEAVWDEDSDPAGQQQAWRAAFYRHGAGLWRDAVLLALSSRDQDPETARLKAFVEAADSWRRPALPVRGADLVARGISGPAVGKVLKFVECWWVANDFVPDRNAALNKLEEAIALVRALKRG